MNRRDGIMRVVRSKLENIEKEFSITAAKVHAGRCLDFVRLLEDYEKDRTPPPINVWAALKRVVRTSETIVSLFDKDSEVPSRLFEVLRENLKDLVICETEKIV